ncbi:hypothetical protein SpCBS45565_g02886 [Spizellomyces sp. 'palustris']|nr:hypothetical protein SpCBS45565_g02886 [Spizellomyces sp. 'palustris']
MLSVQPDAGSKAQQQEAQPDQSQQKDATEPTSSQPKPMFPSKHPLGKFQKAGQFRSPTDNLMSPATQKVEAKRNHLLNKIKPKSLAGRLSDAAAQEQQKQS